MQDYAKTTQPIFTKFGGKVLGTEETTDFGGNPDLDPDLGIF